MGNARDSSSFISTLMADMKLRTLMGVPSDYNNTQMIDKYFCEVVTSGIITESPICRVVLMSNPQSPTGNMYVKEDMLAIEVFVPNSGSTTPYKDRMLPSLVRRSNLIVDRILELFNNKVINNRKLSLEGKHELPCNTVGFCRQFIQFSYLRVYG